MAFVDDFWPHRNVGGVLRPPTLDSRSGLTAGTGHGPRAAFAPQDRGWDSHRQVTLGNRAQAVSASLSGDLEKP